MRSLIAIVLLIVLSLAGASCATKTGTGTAVGGAAGGALGYAIGGWPGLLIGGIAGGAVGNVVGQEMDKEDRRRAAYALEQNRRMEWENAQTGARYEVVPTQTSRLEGRECRNFQMTSYIDGRPEEITGVACRRSDGSWEMMDDAG
jgi:surface antigen